MNIIPTTYSNGFFSKGTLYTYTLSFSFYSTTGAGFTYLTGCVSFGFSTAGGFASGSFTGVVSLAFSSKAVVLVS